MHEIVVNLHMHTRYSDGTGTHKDIAHAAIKAGLDAVIVTDHNVLVQGVEGYYRVGAAASCSWLGRKSMTRTVTRKKTTFWCSTPTGTCLHLADDPQTLINGVAEAGGLSFIAHPRDPEAPAFKETDISWEAWDVHGYTGIELWNGLSELKTVVPTKLHGAFYAFFPQFIGHSPILETLQRWDRSAGRRISMWLPSVARMRMP